MARRNPDAALEVALEQRKRVFDEAQLVLSQRARMLQEAASALLAAQSRVQMVLGQMDAAQRPVPGVALPVAVLGDLEALLAWCEHQVVLQHEQVVAAQSEVDDARTGVATAHQGVRALELVLAARAAERAEKRHRAEL